MQAHIPSYSRLPKRSYLWMTLLVICALFSHSLDTCAAHLGAFANTAVAAPQMVIHCDDEDAADCEVCNVHEKQHDDGCDSFAEIAVLNSSQHHSDHHVVTTTSFAIIPAVPQLLLLSGSFDPRAGPAFAAPVSTYLRSSLPVRAPPFSV